MTGSEATKSEKSNQLVAGFDIQPHFSASRTARFSQITLLLRLGDGGSLSKTGVHQLLRVGLLLEDGDEQHMIVKKAVSIALSSLAELSLNNHPVCPQRGTCLGSLIGIGEHRFRCGPWGYCPRILHGRYLDPGNVIRVGRYVVCRENLDARAMIKDKFRPHSALLIFPCCIVSKELWN
jgi:hypothetical protein